MESLVRVRETMGQARRMVPGLQAPLTHKTDLSAPLFR